MTLRHIKTGYFWLEGLNAFATTYYFNYLFFYTQWRFQFNSAHNLWLGAFSGFVYIFCSWQAGKFAQRFGYHLALRLGFSILALALLAGWRTASMWGQIGVLLAWTVGLCFTWPTLEALVSEGESALGVQRMVGIYNIVWAGGSALAYFLGGLLMKTLGMSSLFLFPMAIHLGQLVLLAWLHYHSPGPSPSAGLSHREVVRDNGAAGSASPTQDPGSGEAPGHPVLTKPSPATAKAFLRMAWLANPFAYIAINTVIAIIPTLAKRLELSLAMAGVFCSIWYFARLFAFVWLWQWPRWHYRFSWLMGAYLSLLVSFLVLLLVPHLAFVIVAQIVFGLAAGLTYYSSLFYSMDVGDTKGEHGGFHEAALGIGLCLGPAIAASALQLLPQVPNSGAWAVGLVLTLGAAGIGWLKPASADR